MFSFFKKRETNIYSITFPDFGWKKEDENSELIKWYNADKSMVLSINFVRKVPDLPNGDIDHLRIFFNEIASSNNLAYLK